MNGNILYTCFCCENKFYSNDTKPEHIIPNCIGGKLKSKSIICNDCNNKFSKIDESIANALKDLTNILNPTRNNKTKSQLPHKFKSENFNYIREANGKIYACNIKEVKKNQGLKIQAEVRYSKENNAKENALKPIFKILEKYCKQNKIPRSVLESKKEEIRNMPTTDEEMPIVPYTVDFDSNPNIFLGLLKIAVEFYIFKRGSFSEIKNVITILRNSDFKTAKDFVKYFYQNNLLPNDGIYHFIYLKGDNISKKLYCIISLYSCLSVFVLLDGNYIGKSFSYKYLFDLIENKEIDFKREINFTSKDIFGIINNPQNYTLQMVQCVNKFMFVNKCREISIIAYRLSCEVVDYLASKPFILSEDEFRKEFASSLNSKFQAIPFIPTMFKSDRINICEIFSKVIPYQQYTNACTEYKISSIIGKVISNEFVKSNGEIPSKEYLYNKIISQISYTRDVTLHKFLGNKDNKQDIRNFIELMHPNLCKYKRIFYQRVP